MRIEASTNVDKKIYVRVASVQHSVDNNLIAELVDKGIKRTDIKFEYEDLNNSTCCPQMKITAYATPTDKRLLLSISAAHTTLTNKKRTKSVLDDETSKSK